VAMLLGPFLVLLYIVIAYAMVRRVRRITTDRRLRTIAVAIALLIPSWDVVLSGIIYYIACPFFSTVSIYETAKTDGIYYEGYLRDTVYIGTRKDGTLVNRIALSNNDDIKRGYQYMEFLITKKHEQDRKLTTFPRPIIYRCIEDMNDYIVNRAQCFPVEEVKSKYLVESNLYSFALIQMGFVKVYERSTGRLMAEYREIRKDTDVFPFFVWLRWAGEPGNQVCCPEESLLNTFQYDVLEKI